MPSRPTKRPSARKAGGRSVSKVKPPSPRSYAGKAWQAAATKGLRPGSKAHGAFVERSVAARKARAAGERARARARAATVAEYAGRQAEARKAAARHEEHAKRERLAKSARINVLIDNKAPHVLAGFRADAPTGQRRFLATVRRALALAGVAADPVRVTRKLDGTEERSLAVKVRPPIEAADIYRPEVDRHPFELLYFFAEKLGIRLRAIAGRARFASFPARSGRRPRPASVGVAPADAFWQRVLIWRHAGEDAPGTSVRVTSQPFARVARVLTVSNPFRGVDTVYSDWRGGEGRSGQWPSGWRPHAFLLRDAYASKNMQLEEARLNAFEFSADSFLRTPTDDDPEHVELYTPAARVKRAHRLAARRRAHTRKAGE